MKQCAQVCVAELAASSAERRQRQLSGASGVLDKDRAQLEVMKENFHRVERMLEVNRRIKAVATEQAAINEQIEEMTRATSDRYKAIRLRFAKLIQQVLGLTAQLFVRVNERGNIDYRAEFNQAEKDDAFTSEASGTTYKKFLCMAFDLAVVTSCAGERFFRFLYHDGALETEDNRKKIRWLEVVRAACDEFPIQYIPYCHRR